MWGIPGSFPTHAVVFFTLCSLRALCDSFWFPYQRYMLHIFSFQNVFSHSTVLTANYFECWPRNSRSTAGCSHRHCLWPANLSCALPITEQMNREAKCKESYRGRLIVNVLPTMTALRNQNMAGPSGVHQTY